MARKPLQAIISAMLLLAAALGWLTGILINILADSLPRFRRPAWPACAACGAQLPRAAWSGLLAWLAGRQACLYCGRRRGWRAPLVELGMAAICIWIAGRGAPAQQFWAGWLTVAIYLLIAIIDVEHRLIMHIVSLPAAVIMAVLGSQRPGQGPLNTLIGGAAGFAIVFGMFLLGEFFLRLIGRLRHQPVEEIAFGFGDVTLAAVIGLSVGWTAVVAAILLGVLAAGAFSLAYLGVMLARRRYVAFTPIPYGPFLILGALIVYF
jgi:prepilin signal peptidase PulO-like enzyme (type II secretory pathway)